MTKLPFFSLWVIAVGFLIGFYFVAPFLIWIGI